MALAGRVLGKLDSGAQFDFIQQFLEPRIINRLPLGSGDPGEPIEHLTRQRSDQQAVADLVQMIE